MPSRYYRYHGGSAGPGGRRFVRGRTLGGPIPRRGGCGARLADWFGASGQGIGRPAPTV
jgi:hypothetical protein